MLLDFVTVNTHIHWTLCTERQMHRHVLKIDKGRHRQHTDQQTEHRQKRRQLDIQIEGQRKRQINQAIRTEEENSSSFKISFHVLHLSVTENIKHLREID